MRVLLLENIHAFARKQLEEDGFEVELLAKALSEEDLIQALRGVQVLGIRSKTQLTAKVFEKATDLIAVGCFCVGTNQVDLASAKSRGIAVFNAPFSNTRSVAEMVLAEMILLSRQLGDRNREMHAGIWNKVSKDCFEVRGKTLGIVGYGNIGTQLSMLAESIGMRVAYYDVVSKLSLGRAKPQVSLDALLADSDFITLHVPETALTNRMMGAREFEKMKKGSYLINASRGQVVDLEALRNALGSGHLRGAALDVYPEEPESNGKFMVPLAGVPNVFLTPHVGGATEEAQLNIGGEVASLLSRFVKLGSTLRGVNFPEVDLPHAPRGSRLSNVHRNVPGVLKEIARILSEAGANVEAQSLATDMEVGYVVIDVGGTVSASVVDSIAKLPTSLRTRVHEIR